MILYALIMHGDHDIDSKKKKKSSDLPTLIFFGM